MTDNKLCKARVVFVLGGPGSGKGTQCEKLVEKFGFNHLSTGDLLREACKSDDAMGKELKAIMERGELVSMDMVLALLKDAMIKCVDNCCYFLIDGYPRELCQGVTFENKICECMCVVFFDVSEEVMRDRLLKRGQTSGRMDDNEETIIKRFRTFNEATRPVIDYFEKQKKVIKIDASGSVDSIFDHLTTELAKLGVK